MSIERLVREPERRQITGVSRVQWWRLERDGLAPRRVVLSPNAVAWPLTELQQWVRGRVAERDGEAA